MFQFTPELLDSKAFDKETGDQHGSEHALPSITSPGPYAVRQEQQGGFNPKVEEPGSYDEKNVKTATATLSKSNDIKPIVRRGSKKSGVNITKDYTPKNPRF